MQKEHMHDLYVFKVHNFPLNNIFSIFSLRRFLGVRANKIDQVWNVEARKESKKNLQTFNM